MSVAAVATGRLRGGVSCFTVLVDDSLYCTVFGQPAQTLTVCTVFSIRSYRYFHIRILDLKFYIWISGYHLTTLLKTEVLEQNVQVQLCRYE